MLFWLSDVRGDIGVLWRFEVWPPPVAYCILNDPILFHAILPAKSL